VARCLSFSVSISIVSRLDVYRGVAIRGRESGLLQTASAPVTNLIFRVSGGRNASPAETPL
jgi:hypothetical protein